MQGAFIHGSRPKTKKALREAVENLYAVGTDPDDPKTLVRADPYSVVMEATSVFGNEYDGSLASAPKETKFSVVGPDPHTKRNWYATVSFNQKKEQWEVK